MKLLVVIATVLHLALGASISDVTCPDSCTCQVKDEYWETSCVSYEFIKKLLPKQESTIVRLNINNVSLINIDLKLRYLKNLHTLDLSFNSITTLPSQFPYLPKLKNLNLSRNRLNEISFLELPKNLEVVDLSHNFITNFPKDWSNLKHLKRIHFHDNPIDCDCDNLSIYEQLLKEGIVLSEDLTCYEPNGRLLNSANCSLIKENLLNSMLGDEAGSGLEDSETIDESMSPLADDQLIHAEIETETNNDELIEEGSGDEGSGWIPPKPCVFNCSTPHSIGLNDETDASPPPNVIEQAHMIFEDVMDPIPSSKEGEFKETPLEESEAKGENSTTVLPIEKEEPIVVKDTDKGEVETFTTNDTVIGGMERASIEESSTQSVYIIVGLLIAFVAFLAIYFIQKKKNQKKRNQRKRNKSNENGCGEEMKPLGKSAEAKPVEMNSKVPNSESAPLLNGQNGKINEENNLKSQPINDDDEKDLEDVELRKPDQDTLTPQPERVTIIAGELPDSIPKTPLLVHRQINSDGEIVTTAINSN